jgi:hypothetical protein
MKRNFFNIFFCFFISIFIQALHGQSLLDPYMPLSAAGYGFGGMIPGSQDSVPNVTLNPAGMTAISRLLLFGHGQIIRETVSGMESGTAGKERTIYYQGGLTVGFPVSFWKKKLYFAGTVNWNTRPELDIIDSRYYWNHTEISHTDKHRIAKFGLGAGFALSNKTHFGISVNRYLGSITQETVLQDILLIEKYEYRYEGLYFSLEAVKSYKNFSAAFLWDSPTTLVEANIKSGSMERNLKHSFSGAAGIGIIYRISTPLKFAVGYKRLFSSKLKKPGSNSETTIEKLHSVTTGIEFLLFPYSIPVRTSISYYIAWLPDIYTISDRSRKQLVLGISSHHSHLGIHTSLSWFNDRYKYYEIPSPVS